ncbi:ABC transporter permease subunit [Peribacillus saganii]|uniref:ABC transporter permease subunit n=1 Tax=Peribacillus saganii TaxID=2303992 RepID=A0A372LU49_9BACI|nr:ABC transporter permease subunit [Peribacillus saganii]RFU71417.1 ABC transporter permease subunit [Peribacillus saganii]
MGKFLYFLTYYKKSLLTLLLILIFVWSLFSVQWNADLLHPGGGVTTKQIFQALLAPDLSPEILILALESTWITLVYAVAGMSIAIILAFFFGILASGVLSTSRFNLFAVSGFFRGILGFTRAIHELVWAWLFVAAIGLSPFAAVFALGIPYGGILGKIFADMLNDIPEEPIKALETAGASKLQTLLYGYLPLVRANIISYVMYRFECSVRSSAIMSFVGLGGLGYQIQLSLSDLQYDEVWTFLFFLIALVVLIDAWSNLLRKRMVL